ncbi:hypothetical protein HGRIS_008906 [Hohenbuehelia grisea]|uniref:Uncharacterized protein n=1 Tax=Hohenbuehelia grisea TaxID=104357 RepID=A0ABR3IZX5_9AGAR
MSTEEDIDRQDGAERRIENHLTPPIGTTFFRFERITLANQQAMEFSSLQDFSQFNYNLTWEIDVYKYAVNGDPRDPDFAANNGQIYVIIVHRGAVRSGQNRHDMRFFFSVSPSFTNNVPLTALHQLPRSGSGVSNGDNLHYEIDFRQTFQMLNNQGNNHFSFDARYFENVVRIESMQISELNGQAARFTISPNTSAGLTSLPANRVYPVQGFSVFTSRDFSTWPIEFLFLHNSGFVAHHNVMPPRLNINRSISLDF